MFRRISWHQGCTRAIIVEKCRKDKIRRNDRFDGKSTTQKVAAVLGTILWKEARLDAARAAVSDIWIRIR